MNKIALLHLALLHLDSLCLASPCFALLGFVLLGIIWFAVLDFYKNKKRYSFTGGYNYNTLNIVNYSAYFIMCKESYGEYDE